MYEKMGRGMGRNGKEKKRERVRWAALYRFSLRYLT